MVLRSQLADPTWGPLYPFESHQLLIDGDRYHYLDESPSSELPKSCPTLLFVHGNPTWSFHWRRLILGFRNDYRCIAPDHLGCGRSSLPSRPLRLDDRIDHLVRLIESLDLRQITLVAQDWGGAIGLGALLKARERFERIALFNTGAFPPWFIPWRIRLCRGPVLGRLAVQGANAFSRAALRMTMARTSHLDPEVAQAYLAPYDNWRRRAAVYQFVRDIPLGPQHPTWQTLDDIERGLPSLSQLPIQLIWGMRDWCFTPECLERFCQSWPDAEVHCLEDVGHWVVEDAPDESEALLGDWLQRTALAESGTLE